MWPHAVSTGVGGVLQKIWVEVRDLLLKTFTLFTTKVCDIPYPIYDLN